MPDSCPDPPFRAERERVGHPFHAMAGGCATPPISAASADHFYLLLFLSTIRRNRLLQLLEPALHGVDLAQGCCLITLDHHEATAIRGDVERRFLAFSSVGTRKQPSRRLRPKAGTCLHRNIHPHRPGDTKALARRVTTAGIAPRPLRRRSFRKDSDSCQHTLLRVPTLAKHTPPVCRSAKCMRSRGPCVESEE